ncbi:MAG: glycogen synthase [Deltaproteobacteria bacterium]|nr:glycogen synthase [Deltaproteobacteria bacterium]
MNLLFVASEMAPFAKTGGLADVIGALPAYLAEAGHDVRVVMPLYDTVDTSKLTLEAVGDFAVPLGPHRYSARVFRKTGNAPTVYFVHCPELYGRGRLYTSDGDEHRRFLALSYVALFICQRFEIAPDIIHVHDWQAALIPMLLKTLFAKEPLFRRTRTLLTIHNLMYQGSFPVENGPDTNLDKYSDFFHQDLMKQGRVNILLQGVLYADGVSTVSPTYAKEIQTPALGGGLDGLLRARSSTVVGILNGVDYKEWSPETDRFIPHKYSASDLSGKEHDKQHLLNQLGLPYQKGVPVIGIVSRLVGQKGFALLAKTMPELLRRLGFQLVVLGSGEPALEDMFGSLQRAFPRQVCFYQGFKNDLAHLIEAGADMFLMPSVYEPCGLNQLYSLRYGTVPIVHRTGGLADTVQTWSPSTGTGTGFAFEHHDEAGLRWAIQAALATYKKTADWDQLVQNGMAADFSWQTQGKLYELVYKRLAQS